MRQKRIGSDEIGSCGQTFTVMLKDNFLSFVANFAWKLMQVAKTRRMVKANNLKRQKVRDKEMSKSLTSLKLFQRTKVETARINSVENYQYVFM